MSAHVPNTMTWHTKSGVFSRVASADRHQHTRRAMEVSRSEPFSVVSVFFTTFWIQQKYNKPGVNVELGSVQQMRCDEWAAHRHSGEEGFRDQIAGA
jgi:hypothetical protein